MRFRFRDFKFEFSLVFVIWLLLFPFDSILNDPYGRIPDTGQDIQ